MFPIGDDNDHSGLAFVTVSLIALNGLAFLLEINQPTDAHVQAFITAWGVVPREDAPEWICPQRSRIRSGPRC